MKLPFRRYQSGTNYVARYPDAALSYLVGAPGNWFNTANALGAGLTLNRPLDSFYKTTNAPFSLDDLLATPLSANDAQRLAQRLIDRDAVYPIVCQIMHLLSPGYAAVPALESLAGLDKILPHTQVLSELAVAIGRARPSQLFTPLLFEMIENQPWLADAIANAHLSRTDPYPLLLAPEEVDRFIQAARAPGGDGLLALICLAPTSEEQWGKLFPLLQQWDSYEGIRHLLPGLATTQARLGDVLSLLGDDEAITDPKPWLEGGYANEARMRAIAPYCTPTGLVGVLTRGGDFVAPVSAALVTQVAPRVAVDYLAAHMLGEALGGGPASLPYWYTARLLLRVPGLAQRFLTLEPSVSKRRGGYYMRIERALERLEAMRPDVAMLLENPSASLGEALYVANALARV